MIEHHGFWSKCNEYTYQNGIFFKTQLLHLWLVFVKWQVIKF